MDTTTMVTPKPPAYLDQGQQAVDAVREAGVPLRYAFWGYFGNSHEYRLVMPTEDVARRGPLAVYSDIQRAFAKADIKIPLRLIMLIRDNSPLGQMGLNALRMARPFAVKTPGGGSLVTNTALNVTVDTRYVYN